MPRSIEYPTVNPTHYNDSVWHKGRGFRAIETFPEERLEWELARCENGVEWGGLEWGLIVFAEIYDELSGNALEDDTEWKAAIGEYMQQMLALPEEVKDKVIDICRNAEFGPPDAIKKSILYVAGLAE